MQLFVQSAQALEKQTRQERFSLAIVDVLCDKNITSNAFDSHCVRKLRQWIPSFEPLCSRTLARSILPQKVSLVRHPVVSDLEISVKTVWCTTDSASNRMASGRLSGWHHAHAIFTFCS
jgi:hypothetical protein